MGISRAGWLIRFPFDAGFLEEFKDAIDYHYREWRPALKSWFVDEDCEPVLTELFENWRIAPRLPPRKTSKPITICSKCKGTGLVPFKNKYGKVILNCWTHCDCHPVYGANPLWRQLPVRLKDYDFACSDSFRAWIYQSYGVPDPGYVPPQTEPEKRPFTPRPVINVTYKVADVNTPAFKDLREQLTTLKGRLTKYFEERGRQRGEY